MKKRKSKKINLESRGTILLTISIFILILLFNKPILDMTKTNFIEKYLIIISISLFALGFISLQIPKKRIKLKKDLLNATIYSFVSLILGIVYLAYPKDILLSLSIGTFSIILFLGAVLYFFLIIIKEKMSLEK